ncbi:MAG: hypothetical protein HY000_30255 [Planctomycetes bacterium]|nr:hypothetical protein [Planctomycetota bacterium]
MDVTRMNWMLVCVPLALVLDWLRAPPWIVFLASAASIVPLASLMERATESLAHVLGPNVGGLLSASLGNAPEMIIAISALLKGLDEIVKASIAGSILGNLLFNLTHDGESHWMEGVMLVAIYGIFAIGLFFL